MERKRSFHLDEAVSLYEVFYYQRRLLRLVSLQNQIKQLAASDVIFLLAMGEQKTGRSGEAHSENKY